MQNSGKIQTWFLNAENPRGHHLWGFLFLLKLLTSFFKDSIAYAFYTMRFISHILFPLKYASVQNRLAIFQIHETEISLPLFHLPDLKLNFCIRE